MQMKAFIVQYLKIYEIFILRITERRYLYIEKRNLRNIFMKKQNYMSWEAYFMSMGILSSFRSKDKKTQTGACIIGTDNKIIGVGYNGLPAGLDDSNPKFWTDVDDTDVEHSKHTYVVHAERNAIYNAVWQNLKGATIYATLFPCANVQKYQVV